jgi:hypothetical protein
MFLFPVMLILAPGIISTLYYLHINADKKVEPYKLVGLCLMFIFLCNMFPMLLTMIRRYNVALTVIGEGAVWYSLQFCVKYMIMSLVAAVIMPWVVAFVESNDFKRLKHIVSISIDRIEKAALEEEESENEKLEATAQKADATENKNAEEKAAAADEVVDV